MRYQNSVQVAIIYGKGGEAMESNDPIEAVKMYRMALALCAEAIEMCNNAWDEATVKQFINIYRNRIAQLDTSRKKRRVPLPARPGYETAAEKRPKSPRYWSDRVNVRDDVPKELMNLYEIESRVHALINKKRTENGLKPLAYDDDLASIARGHSADMAHRNFFGHINPDGLGPSDRADNAGYVSFRDHGRYYTEGIGENILQTNFATSVTYVNGIPVRYNWKTIDELVESAVEEWMKSPGHRRNILDARYEKEGIGVAIGPENKVYITENFC